MKPWTIKDVISELRKRSQKDKKKELEGLKRFNMPINNRLLVRMSKIREVVKLIKKDIKDENKRHIFALKLWKNKYREIKFVSAFIDVPRLVTEKQAENMIKTFDGWGICDSTCGDLLDKTSFAWKKAIEWTKRKKEFEKRAGFATIAWMAVHDKKTNDKKFLEFFPLIKRESKDERNLVKKAVNWALRQIGKRSIFLRKKAIKTAEEILKIDDKTAKWIARDALRELKR